jgi:hypothetical protein
LGGRLPVMIPFPEDWRERFEGGEILFEDISLVIVASDMDEARALAKEVKARFEIVRDSLGEVEELRREIADFIRVGREADALLGLLFLAARAKLHPTLYAWVLPLYASGSGGQMGAMAVLSSTPKGEDAVRALSHEALQRIRAMGSANPKA